MKVGDVVVALAKQYWSQEHGNGAPVWFAVRTNVDGSQTVTFLILEKKLKKNKIKHYVTDKGVFVPLRTNSTTIAHVKR